MSTGAHSYITCSCQALCSKAAPRLARVLTLGNLLISVASWEDRTGRGGWDVVAHHLFIAMARLVANRILALAGEV